jgi:hypothetical protein
MGWKYSTTRNLFSSSSSSSSSSRGVEDGDRGEENKISCRREKKYSYYVKHSVLKKKAVVLLSKGRV